jgi:maleamate amidohydrolase
MAGSLAGTDSSVSATEHRALRESYAARGFGGRVGLGVRPAVIVVDLASAWLDPGNQSLGSHQESVIQNAIAVLAAARSTSHPVFFTVMGFREDLVDASLPTRAKWPCGAMVLGSPDVKLDPRLGRRRDEILITKQRQSAFFGTTLASHLVARNADTVIVVGLSTSGCIRSTCESAFNYNYRVIVPNEAVGDRCAAAHQASLFDIDMLFGDVVQTADVLRYLTTSREQTERAEIGVPRSEANSSERPAHRVGRRGQPL